MRLQRLLLSLQMALTVSLLVSGGLMTRSLYAIRSVDPGFQARGLSTARISIPNHLLEVSAPASQPPDEAAEETRRAEARIRILGMILDRLAALPGVEDATSADVLPFPGDRVSSTTVAIAGGDGQELRLDPDRFRVWPGFHEAMGIPLLAGRTFASADQGDGGRVAVISESFARRYWPDESALGKKIDDFEGDPLTVVGIVGDVKVGDLSIDVRPTYYLSFGQSSWSKVSLVVRSAEGTGALSEQIRQAIHNVNPSILVLEEGRLSAMVAWSAREDEYRALLMGVFAILATVLAAVGIYGVTARGVSRRSRELSVRIAVGADRTRLVSRTVVESMGASLSGIAVGLLTAFWASQLLERFLFGVRVTDLWTYGVVTVFAVLMSGSASLLPAMGITRIDPARVLKEE